MIDIQRQLMGSAVNDKHAQKMLQREMPLEQIDLMKKLFTWLMSNSLKDEWRR